MAVIDNLAVYYDLDEASGNAIDSHSNSLDLTETGGTIGASTGPGGSGGSRVFAIADTEWFVRGDHAAISMGDIAVSLAFWAYIDVRAAGVQNFVAKYTGTDVEYLVDYSNSVTKLRFYVASGTSYANLTNVESTNTPPEATWFFVVCRHDPTNNKLFISVDDGTPAETAYSAGSWDSGSDLWIGSNPDNSYLGGRMAKVGIWKKLLSDAEETWLYNSGSGRSYDDIVAEAGSAVIPVFMNQYRQRRA
jgi:hypothetical protein